MWKFQDFLTTQIFREINLPGHFEAPKTIKFDHLCSSEFWIFGKLWHFQMWIFSKNQNSKLSKWLKRHFSHLLNPEKRQKMSRNIKKHQKTARNTKKLYFSYIIDFIYQYTCIPVIPHGSPLHCLVSPWSPIVFFYGNLSNPYIFGTFWWFLTFFDDFWHFLTFFGI